LWPDSFDEWAQRLYEEGTAHGAAAQAARNYGASWDQANDLADEAVAHCLQRVAELFGNSPGHFSTYEDFRNYVRRCAVNSIHDHFRRARRSPQIEVPDVVPAPQKAMDEETAARIRQCWESLSERDRALLTRYYLDGLTLDAVADEFLPPDGRTPNARRLDIHRQIREARASLWQCLLNHEVDPRYWGCQE
jgi:RNA polymerase sigma factor (sigma-70 family)